jgi:hypothetical protein
MTALGQDGAGALVIWTDIKPEAEADFNRWYDHQHLEERVNVPGFINGRRYQAIGDAPAKFLAWYEVESPDVLGSAAYGARQANPTEWTSRIMPEFLNVTRVTSSRIAKSGGGLGCIAASLSFECTDDRAEAVSATLTGLVEKLIECPGIVAAQAWRPSQADAAAGTTEANLRAHEENPPVWTLMIEATSEAAVDTALQKTDSVKAVSGASSSGVTTGLYGLVLARGAI